MCNVNHYIKDANQFEDMSSFGMPVNFQNSLVLECQYPCKLSSFGMLVNLPGLSSDGMQVNLSLLSNLGMPVNMSGLSSLGLRVKKLSGLCLIYCVRCGTSEVSTDSNTSCIFRNHTRATK